MQFCNSAGIEWDSVYVFVRQEQVNIILQCTYSRIYLTQGVKANNIIFTTTRSERGRRLFLITCVCNVFSISVSKLTIIVSSIVASEEYKNTLWRNLTACQSVNTNMRIKIVMQTYIDVRYHVTLYIAQTHNADNIFYR